MAMGLPPVTMAELEAMAEPVEAPNGSVIGYIPPEDIQAFIEARDVRWRLVLEQMERRYVHVVAALAGSEGNPEGAQDGSQGGQAGPQRGDQDDPGAE